MCFPAAYQSVVFCEDLLHFYVFEFNKLGHKQFCVILLVRTYQAHTGGCWQCWRRPLMSPPLEAGPGCVSPKCLPADSGGILPEPCVLPAKEYIMILHDSYQLTYCCFVTRGREDCCLSHVIGSQTSQAWSLVIRLCNCSSPDFL